jgi:carbamoyl-phosphate synthase (ammonia)
MIGNYGVPDRKVLDKYGLPAYFESTKIHAQALIVQDYSHHYSHWNAVSSLGDWLKEEGIPGLSGLDTRLLTKKIRSRGAMLGRIEIDPNAPMPDFTKIPNPNMRNLVAEVSTRDVKVYGKGNPMKILAVDCGVKANIIRQLCDRGAELTLVPFDYPFAAELHKFDGLFLSNGPGDPNMLLDTTVAQLKQVINCSENDVKVCVNTTSWKYGIRVVSPRLISVPFFSPCFLCILFCVSFPAADFWNLHG